jgi:hypothetical protein
MSFVFRCAVHAAIGLVGKPSKGLDYFPILLMVCCRGDNLDNSWVVMCGFLCSSQEAHLTGTEQAFVLLHSQQHWAGMSLS